MSYLIAMAKFDPTTSPEDIALAMSGETTTPPPPSKAKRGKKPGKVKPRKAAPPPAPLEEMPEEEMPEEEMIEEETAVNPDVVTSSLLEIFADLKKKLDEVGQMMSDSGMMKKAPARKKKTAPRKAAARKSAPRKAAPRRKSSSSSSKKRSPGQPAKSR
jgi:hypothetical protein